MRGIWLALAVFVAGCAFAAPLPGKPVQKCARATASQQAPEPDKRGTESSPLSVKLVNTGENTTEAVQKSEAIKHTEQAERWTIGLTVALAAATLLQFGALVWQGQQLRRQIALGQAEFIAAHRPMFLIREPYLAVIHCPGDPAERTAYQVRFFLANSGEGEGTLVESYAVVMQIPLGSWKYLGAEEGEAPINQFGPRRLAAGGYEEIFFDLGAEESETVSLLLAMHEDNQALIPRLWLRGVFAYTDENRIRRRTALCRSLDYGTKNFLAGAGNEYDYAD